MNSVAPLPVVVPLGAAALLLMSGSKLSYGLVRALTIAATTAEIVLAAVLVHGARSDTIVYWFGGWAPRHGLAIGVSFAVDRLGAGAAAFAGAIVATAVVTARRSFGERFVLTHVLMLTMLAAMAGFCLTGDIFNLFVFYELIAVSAFGLAAYNTASVPSMRAALNFAITNSIGAFLFLIGIALLYGRTGALNLAEIGRQLGRAQPVDGLVVIAVATISVGLLVKAAVMPFHFWLVDVATSGPLPLVLVLGGALDALAVYAIARIYWTALAPTMSGHHHALEALLVALGASSAVIGAALAMSVRGARRVLAFVMVSHTGTLLVGVGCLSALGLAGAAVYAVAGGAVKAALFAGVATLARDDDSHATGVATIAVLAAGGIALAGLPIFGVSLGESVIERSTPYGAWVVPALIAASVLSGIAVLRVAIAAARSRGSRPRRREPAVVAIALLGVAIGARFVLTRWVTAAASALVASTAYQRSVLNGVKVRSISTIGSIGLPARDQIVDLGAVAVAVATVVWLDRLRPRARRRTEDPGGTIVGNAVRRLHGGSLGDSVAWATLGATVIAVTLATTLR